MSFFLGLGSKGGRVSTLKTSTRFHLGAVTCFKGLCILKLLNKSMKIGSHVSNFDLREVLRVFKIVVK